MSTDVTTLEMRRELQQLISEERDLIDRASNAIASGEYVRLQDTANQLVKVAERRTLLRAAVIAAKAREAVEQSQGIARRANTDQAADTWRLLH